MLSEDNIEPFKWSKYVPYRLEREKVSSFPEFYFHFKMNFARTSMQFEAYCNFGSDAEEFKAKFSGSRKEKSRALEAIELSFSELFKRYLSSELQLEYENLIFTKVTVETVFQEKLLMHPDPCSYDERYMSLLEKAKTGDVTPLIYFLQAYEFSDDHIWVTVTAPFAHSGLSVKQRRILNRRVMSRKKKSGSLLLRLRDLVQDLKDEDIIPRPSSGTGNNKKTSTANSSSEVGGNNNPAVVQPQVKKREHTPEEKKEYRERQQEKRKRSKLIKKEGKKSAESDEKADKDVSTLQVVKRNTFTL